jgi:hypothetical protein
MVLLVPLPDRLGVLALQLQNLWIAATAQMTAMKGLVVCRGLTVLALLQDCRS